MEVDRFKKKKKKKLFIERYSSPSSRLTALACDSIDDDDGVMLNVLRCQLTY